MMKFQRYLLILLSFCIVACSGEGRVCPTIFIPVYKVIVYDSVTGSQLCIEESGLSDNSDCSISYKYTDRGHHADIRISLQGYQEHTELNVANRRNVAGCFSDPAYTTEVEIFLVPN